jgi:hypothetical protein
MRPYVDIGREFTNGAAYRHGEDVHTAHGIGRELNTETIRSLLI